MLPRRFRKDNASGAALIITILVMAALTILGIMSINTSVVEMYISRSDREIRESFYLAEGVVMEGIQQLMILAPKDLDEQYAPWHHAKSRLAGERIDFRNPEDWDTNGDENDNAVPSTLAQDSFLAAVEWGVATGGSLIQTDTRLYQNRIYGLCIRNNTATIIEVGYYLRY